MGQQWVVGKGLAVHAALKMHHEKCLSEVVEVRNPRNHAFSNQTFQGVAHGSRRKLRRVDNLFARQRSQILDDPDDFRRAGRLPVTQRQIHVTTQ